MNFNEAVNPESVKEQLTQLNSQGKHYIAIFEDKGVAIRVYNSAFTAFLDYMVTRFKLSSDQVFFKNKSIDDKLQTYPNVSRDRFEYQGEPEENLVDRAKEEMMEKTIPTWEEDELLSHNAKKETPPEAVSTWQTGESLSSQEEKIAQIEQLILNAVDKKEYFNQLTGVGILKLSEEKEAQLEELLKGENEAFIKALFERVVNLPIPIYGINPLSVLINIFAKDNNKLKDLMFEDGVLKPQAIRLIIERLKEENKIPQESHVIVCDSYEQFISEAEKISALEVSEGEKLHYQFIARFQAPYSNKEGAHVTPIYLERSSKGMGVVILDSVPRSSYVNWLEAMLEHGLPNTEVFCYASDRQKDGFMCPIFAIHDVIQMAHTENLLDFAKKSNEEFKREQNSDTNRFPDLPTAFLKPSHDMDIINQLPGQKNEVFSINKQEKNIRTVMHKGEQKEHNLFAERKYAKRAAELIAQFIAESNE